MISDVHSRKNVRDYHSITVCTGHANVSAQSGNMVRMHDIPGSPRRPFLLCRDKLSDCNLERMAALIRKRSVLTVYVEAGDCDNAQHATGLNLI